MKKDIKPKVAKKETNPRWYEGYDIRWLKSTTDHPDYKLVAEYEAIYGEVK